MDVRVTHEDEIVTIRRQYLLGGGEVTRQRTNGRSDA